MYHLHLDWCSDKIQKMWKVRCSDIVAWQHSHFSSWVTNSTTRILGAVPNLFTRASSLMRQMCSCAIVVKTDAKSRGLLICEVTFQFQNKNQKPHFSSRTRIIRWLVCYLNSKWAICMPDPIFSFLGMTWSTIGPSAGWVNWRVHVR